MSDPLLFPKLRWPIDLRFEEAQGEKFLFINCPLGISLKPLLLKPAVAPLIAQFEGQLSIDQIAAQFSGLGVHRDLVLRLAQLLDDHLFLASPRFFEAEKSIKEAFRLSGSRPSALAGLSYSGSRAELEREIDGFLASSSSVEFKAPLSAAQRTPIGIVSPHIDYRRGGACYGRAYHHFRDAKNDLLVVIGTAHQYSPHLFHLTTKDFETPLGVIPNHREFTQQLAARYGAARSFADEFLHRREHSLELQLPFLQRVSSTTAFCPILVGSFHSYVAKQRLPNDFDEYDSFAGALAEGIAAQRRAGMRVGIVAGVDMAHIGRQFGDNAELTDDWLAQVAARDQEYLTAVLQQDKAKLFSHIAEDQDQRRICGFPTLYTVIDVFDRLGLRYDSILFEYSQAVNKPEGCAVTFAGIGLYEKLAL